MPYMECKLCDKSFSGPEPYAQHLICKAHLEKVEEKGIEKSQLLETGSISSKQYKCDECEVELSGPVPLEQHFQGSKHKAMLNKKRILQEQGPKNSNEESTLSLTCNICDKVFSGPESYEDHVKSKKHQRKVEMLDMKERLTSQEPATCPPPVDDAQEEKNNQSMPLPNSQNLYPALPKEPTASIRAHAPKKLHKKAKKPTGCFSGFRSSFKKQNKKKK